MSIEFGLAIFIIVQLRKSLQTKIYFPDWDNVLKNTMIFCIVLLCIEIPLREKFDMRFTAIANVILVMLVAIIYLQPVFRPARTYIHAWWPFITVSIVKDTIEFLLPSFYTSIESLLETATVFSALWLVGMMIVTSKQRKTLNNVRLQAEEEEKKKRMMESLKAELEIQVAERTSELTLQKNELEHALEELKATQVQLIHAEKMASLGELTAGIAHEIQNPLNFVNNFSDLNTELLEELKQEIEKGNTEEAKAIASDIQANEQKIIYHGKRADAIVKGMLQHSRASTGQKEVVDLNELCDEYLRLSYHGLRAKDKFFNANFSANLDPGVGEVKLIPQDIGRVLLNLFNNSFYAVSEKKKLNLPGYEPTVTLRTKRYIDHVEIRVRDNGTGIPESVIDKMFQPFFTTKPTGQGTGLGLSLSFDIVTKGHGGTLEVKTKEGEFAEFIIELPTDI
jgi:signal transduction histidine kinase